MLKEEKLEQREAGAFLAEAVQLQGRNHPSGHIFPICTNVLCGLWGPEQSKNEGHLGF